MAASKNLAMRNKYVTQCSIQVFLKFRLSMAENTKFFPMKSQLDISQENPSLISSYYVLVMY